MGDEHVAARRAPTCEFREGLYLRVGNRRPFAPPAVQARRIDEAYCGFIGKLPGGAALFVDCPEGSTKSPPDVSISASQVTTAANLQTAAPRPKDREESGLAASYAETLKRPEPQRMFATLKKTRQTVYETMVRYSQLSSGFGQTNPR